MNDLTGTLAPQLAVVPQATLQQGINAATGDSKKDPGFQPFGNDGFTFLDLIDIVNPLQHIPIVSSLYRNITGDTLDPASSIAGGALFGGPIGAAASVINVVVDETTGKDMGDHVIAFLSDQDGKNAETIIAENTNITPWKQGNSGLIPPTVQTEELPPLAAAQAPVITEAERQLLKNEGELAQTPNEEFIEVLQWAQNESATKQAAQAPVLSPTTDTSVATNAELELLKAEADAINNNTQTAELSPSRTNSAISENIEVLQWAQRQTTSPEKGSLAAGAIAQQGGWFSDVMLSALDNYQQSASLTNSATPHIVDNSY